MPQPHESSSREGFYDRREFLGRVTPGLIGATALPLLSSQSAQAKAAGDIRVIFINLVGGPSHLDTFDPKPDAPSEIRGPFASIPTRLPGVRLSEHLPRLASILDRVTLVRSLHHDAAPVHETGLQLFQTGHLCNEGTEYPNFGAQAAHVWGNRSSRYLSRMAPQAPFAGIIPSAIESTGIQVSRGQGAGFLGAAFEPAVWNDISPKSSNDIISKNDSALAQYGNHSLGRNLLRVRYWIEQGCRYVTVNMFTTVFDEITWDCHADGGSLRSSLQDYKSTLCPMFDQAYTALILDLEQRGLLESTLVVALGEMGRTPKVNSRGGRDHWTGVWSALLAGGPVVPGQVIGSSDSTGAEPKDTPVTPTLWATSIQKALGVPTQSRTGIPGLV